MRIYIREGDAKPIRIPIPTRLLCSGFTARILCRLIQEKSGENGPAPEYKQVRRLLLILRRSRRMMKGQPLVEVQEAGGNEVRISL